MGELGEAIAMGANRFLKLGGLEFFSLSPPSSYLGPPYFRGLEY